MKLPCTTSKQANFKYSLTNPISIHKIFNLVTQSSLPNKSRIKQTQYTKIRGGRSRVSMKSCEITHKIFFFCWKKQKKIHEIENIFILPMLLYKNCCCSYAYISHKILLFYYIRIIWLTLIIAFMPFITKNKRRKLCIKIQFFKLFIRAVLFLELKIDVQFDSSNIYVSSLSFRHKK